MDNINKKDLVEMVKNIIQDEVDVDITSNWGEYYGKLTGTGQAAGIIVEKILERINYDL